MVINGANDDVDDDDFSIHDGETCINQRKLTHFLSLEFGFSRVLCEEGLE